MKFAQPFFLYLLLLLPLLAWLKGRLGRKPAFLYSSVQLLRGISRTARSGQGGMQDWIRWAALALMIVALARPQNDRSESHIRASGIDIVLALDLSQSMAAEDFTLRDNRVNRVAIAKDVMTEFIKHRPSDRMGLVAFAGRAYVASPLTLDHEFLLSNLDRLGLEQLEDGTAIGSAIATSLNRLKDIQSKSKIVILMTDGQNTAGEVPPLTGAEMAKALNVKIYTVGVGTHGTAPIPVRDDFGFRRYVDMPVDIDEKTLEQIASQTGGKYFRADNTENLRRIYGDIDKMEKTEVVVDRIQHVDELFALAAMPALGLVLLEFVLHHSKWRRLP